MSFQKVISFINSQCVSNNPDTELIRINDLSPEQKYFTEEGFRFNYLTYVQSKLENSNPTTDPENNIQVVRALNTIYLDGDFYFSSSIERNNFMKVSTEIMDYYTQKWIEVISERTHLNNIPSDMLIFKFVPSIYPNNKGGFHAFIYLRKNMSVDEKLEIHNIIKNILVNDPIFTGLLESNLHNLTVDGNFINVYDKIFDTNTIKSQQILLPFAQKSRTSRSYTLTYTNFDSTVPSKFFILPVKHINISNTNDLFTETNEYTADLSAILDEVEDDKNNSILQELINANEQSAFNKFSNLGKVGRIVANFMNSLQYLSQNHHFWVKLADNSDRLKYIITPMIQFIYVNYVLESRKAPDNTNDAFVHSLTRIMIPLLERTVGANDTKTQRATYLSCFNHIKSYYNKYSSTKSIFTDELLAFWDEYCKMKEKQKKSLDYEQLLKLNALKHVFTKVFANWTTFVQKIILAGITDEIRPFKENHRDKSHMRGAVIFDEVLAEQPSVDKRARIDESFYTKTLRLWNTMFLFVGCYDNGTLKESIRAILTAYTRYFIWFTNSIKTNPKLYIYNIRQTRSLCNYPYNQWLLDTEDGKGLRSWLQTIYIQLIKPELQQTSQIIGLNVLFDNLKTANIIPDLNTLQKSIKSLADMSTDIDKLYKNVLDTFDQERYDPPRELDPISSNFLPMRNGLLEFKDDGTVEMHYENHHHFMSIYSNIIYDDNYDYGCAEYQAVKTMWTQIFPVKDERDYALKLYASTLVGGILKDMLIIQQGTGGDGKTISNNALLGMLGAEGLHSHIPVIENNKKVYVENPNGIATTMKTETILVSNKNSHDSGGIIQLKNKRFCTVQEPDPNLSGGKLNCAKIKEILSGTTISGREIFQKAESFSVNALLTLQTNIQLAYTEDTDAIRRRIAIINYRSKFYTEISGDKFNNLEFTYKANPRLSVDLVSNPMYWKALFYYLLPYAQELVKNNVKSLSNIERPATVKSATENSFTNSNGLVGWLCKHVVPKDSSVISISELTNVIINANKEEQQKAGGILNSTKVRDKLLEIRQQLMGTYMGKIYRVKDGYYNNHKTNLLPGFAVNTYDENGQEMSNDAILKQYFEKYAINSMECSLIHSKGDLYLVGYAVEQDEE